MTSLILCPVLDCDWKLDTTPPQVDALTLAGVFGPGVMASVAATQHAHSVEQDLERHLKGHSLVDFLRTIRSLTQQRDEALEALVWVERQSGVPAEAR